MQERSPNSDGDNWRPPAPSLYDPKFEHDSCGVGFVVQLRGGPSHRIVRLGLGALGRMAHRGAVAADELSGDGAGVMLEVPQALVRGELRRMRVRCRASEMLALGMLFVQRERAAAVRRAITSAALHRDLRVLAWREVPVNASALGRFARRTLPQILQVFLAPGSRPLSADQFERTLGLVRSQIEATIGFDDVYICSLSSRTVVYKALCNARQLGKFYPELGDRRTASRFCIFHQRFATNTMPSWAMAQPFRSLAHNGEINTLTGNAIWLEARQRQLPAGSQVAAHPRTSDSALLDNAVESLARAGYSVWQALSALIVPAWENDPACSPELAAFYRAHAASLEPWDGPAALSFSDGRFVGAALDRNGLRPCRYTVTRRGLVLAGSEAGLADLPARDVVESGRLGPGEMLLVDLERGELLRNPAVKKLLARSAPRPAIAVQPAAASLGAHAPLLCEGPDCAALQRIFGYSREDVHIVLASMARDGKEAVWSMGDDTPLPSMARAPRPLYAYLRQRFAQVTNPPMDALRESAVMSLRTWLGPRVSPGAAQTPKTTVLELASPLAGSAQMAALRRNEALSVVPLPCLLGKSHTLENTLTLLEQQAETAARRGASILLLSDRGVDATHAPLPMALAVGAVHHHLLATGLRARVDIVVEAGDCFDVHHLAVLIGFGARVVCPWLALAVAGELVPGDGEKALLRTLGAGLLKVMAKMGVSTVAGYCGGQNLESLGLAREVTERCFRGIATPLGGVGFAEIEAEIRARHRAAFSANSTLLPDHGLLRFRRGGEHHAWNPPLVRALQTAVGSARAAGPANGAGLHVLPSPSPWHEFDRLTESREPNSLRDLLSFRDQPPVPVDEVEPAAAIARRFVTSAMSLGSLSPEAHRTLAIAMNRLGGRSNTGEGGEDPESYREKETGRADNKVKQIASGRFGVTAEYIARAEELEIKIAQGSKPGEGGQIPASKVTELIARLRHAQPGIALISPPPHHDIYSIEDLAQLIFDLRRVNPRAHVGVKLVAESGVGTIAAGVTKARADYVVIAGHSGGTGASPVSSIKHAGLPWELGLAETQQVLVASELRGRVRLRVDGGLQSGRDAMMAALLGADEFAFGTAPLVALGCDMARQCHLNTCPTGIATQRPELRARFRGSPDNVVAYFLHVAEQVRALLAQLGLRSVRDAVGRVDLLEQTRRDGGFDLAPLLQRPKGPARRFVSAAPRSHTPELEDKLAAQVALALKSGRRLKFSGRITNRDRALGARIAGEIAKRIGGRGPAPGFATLDLTGAAGQSFGAFATSGIRLTLTGEANDYVGKGLCGGEIVLRRPAAWQPHARGAVGRNVILGNVALYGATSGLLLAAGAAGERFAVRNSGAIAVVEGVGHHGCEYMTGGVVVVLGPVGMNFGAGMTGGAAYVLAQPALEKRLNRDSVRASTLAPADAPALRQLLERHYEETGSPVAAGVLMNFDGALRRFRKVSPRAAGEESRSLPVVVAAMQAGATG